MSNINFNQINVVLTIDDLASMHQNITSFISKIPENTGLTKEERKKMNAINVDNKIFAEKVFQVAKSLPEVMPSYINLTSFENDLKVFTQLDQLESLLLQALENLQDAKRIAGHEAYITANSTYTFIKEAAKVGVPGTKNAFETLRERYTSKNQGKSRNDNP